METGYSDAIILPFCSIRLINILKKRLFKGSSQLLKRENVIFLRMGLADTKAVILSKTAVFRYTPAPNK